MKAHELKKIEKHARAFLLQVVQDPAMSGIEVPDSVLRRTVADAVAASIHVPRSSWKNVGIETLAYNICIAAMLSGVFLLSEEEEELRKIGEIFPTEISTNSVQFEDSLYPVRILVEINLPTLGPYLVSYSFSCYFINGVYCEDAELDCILAVMKKKERLAAMKAKTPPMPDVT